MIWEHGAKNNPRAAPGVQIILCKIAILQRKKDTGTLDREGKEKNQNISTDKVLSLLRAFVIGAAMAAAWGMASHVLKLEQLFPNESSENMFDIPLPAQLLLYTVVSPLAEEALFRWFLYDLVCRFARWQVAAVIVSALFALWHGNLVQMIYAFPAGLVMQELRRRSHSMGEPVSCHIGANLTAILVNAFLTG